MHNVKFATLELKNGMAEETNKLDLDLDTLPSSDPLSFGYGIQRGMQHKASSEKDFEKIHGNKYSELSQEYLRGFLLGYRAILVPEGTKIRKGNETNFALSNLNILKQKDGE